MKHYLWRASAAFMAAFFLAGAGAILRAQDPLEPAPALPATAAPKKSDLLSGDDQSKLTGNSVVRVFATARYPDISRPWAKQAPREVTGTGVVIEGKRILTEARLILYAGQIQVQANLSGDKLSASIEYCVPGIDLAVLKLDDEAFFDTHPPLTRDGALPALKQPVMAYGYPTGGTALSITKGIVSRIEFAAYGWPVWGVRIQIDAAINAGNMGGPAMAGNKMIGLAIGSLSGAQNIGYILPCEEIELFLKDIADGRIDGKPGFYDSLQTLDNPALRPFLKLPAGAEGILVNQTERTDAEYPLKPWDLIARIGDTPIDNQGMVKLPDGLRIRFQYLIQHLAKDGKVPLTIVRDGKTMTVDLPVVATRTALVRNATGDYPAYFIYGPIVFSDVSSLSYAFFAEAPRSGTTAAPSSMASALLTLAASGNPLVTRRGDKPAEPAEELVFMPAPLFPHRLAKGYSNPTLRVVAAINGIPIKNLKQLVEVLRDSRDEFTVITFAGRGNESLVFPHREMLAATDEILTDAGVREQASPDLLAIWKAKPAH
jgi:S1-C subfamily serine protease